MDTLRKAWTNHLAYRLLWVVVILITWYLSTHGRAISKSYDARWLVKYPSAWKIDFKSSISQFMNWLVEDAHFYFFSFTELTRGISWLIEQPYQFALAILSSGWLHGIGSDAVQVLPPISWLVVIAAVALMGHYARNWTLAALTAACFTYLAVFGQWDSAMVTLASIVIAVPIGVILGLVLGVLVYRYRWFEHLMQPILDLMQTVPVFAYLVPILFLFGFGPVAALVATIIYAMPPMVRNSALALKQVDSELKDLGSISGCSGIQQLRFILLPSARAGIMVGVNQVIMLSLNMVIIASMIGAGGLGYDVLTSLRKLDIGQGIEAGVAIVVLAVALDRLSHAFADSAALDSHRRSTTGWLYYPRTVGVITASLIAGLLITQLNWQWLGQLPESWQFSTGKFWDEWVRYLNVNYFDAIESVKTAILSYFMLPVKRFLVGIPWPWGVALVGILALRFCGWRLAILAILMTAFIVVNGLWSKAMITVYLCGVSVALAALIGIPIGIVAGLHKGAGRVIGVIVDTLQTLPSFVYLIPVVMLFRVGDFTAMIAVILYALAPAIRYTAHGVSAIDKQLLEAGTAAGCTGPQMLRYIRLPIAYPHILLGINQTIMLALSMLVITALVGTRDLGQEVYIALTKADTGRGIVAGLSVAFIAIIADRIVTASARKAQQRMGEAKRET